MSEHRPSGLLPDTLPLGAYHPEADALLSAHAEPTAHSVSSLGHAALAGLKDAANGFNSPTELAGTLDGSAAGTIQPRTGIEGPTMFNGHVLPPLPHYAGASPRRPASKQWAPQPPPRLQRWPQREAILKPADWRYAPSSPVPTGTSYIPTRHLEPLSGRRVPDVISVPLQATHALLGDAWHGIVAAASQGASRARAGWANYVARTQQEIAAADDKHGQLTATEQIIWAAGKEDRATATAELKLALQTLTTPLRLPYRQTGNMAQVVEHKPLREQIDERLGSLQDWAAALPETFADISEQAGVLWRECIPHLRAVTMLQAQRGAAAAGAIVPPGVRRHLRASFADLHQTAKEYVALVRAEFAPLPTIPTAESYAEELRLAKAAALQAERCYRRAPTGLPRVEYYRLRRDALIARDHVQRLKVGDFAHATTPGRGQRVANAAFHAAGALTRETLTAGLRLFGVAYVGSRLAHGVLGRLEQSSRWGDEIAWKAGQRLQPHDYALAFVNAFFPDALHDTLDALIIGMRSLQAHFLDPDPLGLGLAYATPRPAARYSVVPPTAVPLIRWYNRPPEVAPQPPYPLPDRLVPRSQFPSNLLMITNQSEDRQTDGQQSTANPAPIPADASIASADTLIMSPVAWEGHLAEGERITRPLPHLSVSPTAASGNTSSPATSKPTRPLLTVGDSTGWPTASTASGPARPAPVHDSTSRDGFNRPLHDATSWDGESLAGIDQPPVAASAQQALTGLITALANNGREGFEELSSLYRTNIDRDEADTHVSYAHQHAETYAAELQRANLGTYQALLQRLRHTGVSFGSFMAASNLIHAQTDPSGGNKPWKLVDDLTRALGILLKPEPKPNDFLGDPESPLLLPPTLKPTQRWLLQRSNPPQPGSNFFV